MRSETLQINSSAPPLGKPISRARIRNRITLLKNLTRIPAEEIGRFLLAYYRGLFGVLTLGQAFNRYYSLNDQALEDMRSDEKATEYLQAVYTRNLSGGIDYDY